MIMPSKQHRPNPVVAHQKPGKNFQAKLKQIKNLHGYQIIQGVTRKDTLLKMLK